MTDLPPLPEPEATIPDFGNIYQASHMRAYAEAAIKQEREACARTAEDVEEKPWYGYENPNTFQDGKWSAANAIRARSPSIPKGN